MRMTLFAAQIPVFAARIANRLLRFSFRRAFSRSIGPALGR